MMKGKYILGCILFLGVAWIGIHPSFAQEYTISGYVKEKNSGELVPGVTVYLPEQQVGTATNVYGFYSITLAAGTYRITFSSIGLRTHVDTLVLDKHRTYDVNLAESAQKLAEVVVSADEVRRESEEVQMSKISLTAKDVSSLPSLLGEKDVLKVLQLLPGVQSGSEGQSGVYVRGGGPDQNLFILDDAVVYNVNHLFGFFSVFNGDAIKTVDLYKAGFPARFGGRLSSVMNVTMKEGNKKQWHGKVGIGLLSAQMVLEGPLKKDKTSMLFSGRRSYLDPFLRIASRLSNTSTTQVSAVERPREYSSTFNYYLHDYNLKVNHEFNPKDKLYLSGYYGVDAFSLSSVESFAATDKYPFQKDEFSNVLRWGNITGTLRWNHQFSPKVFANMSVIGSDYTFLVGLENNSITGADSTTSKIRLSSQISGLVIKYDVEYFLAANHALRLGTLQGLRRFEPNTTSFQVLDTKTTATNDLTYAFETVLYAEDEMKYGPFQANVGVRMVRFQNNEKVYLRPEPRVSVSYNFLRNFSIKSAYSRMNQYLHLLGTSGASLPTDIWVSATDRVKPQYADQLVLGLALDMGPRADYSITLEGYYKDLKDIIAYKDGIVQRGAVQDGWESQVTVGEGNAYGAEVLFRKNRGNFTGWVGYTLSYVINRFPAINKNRPFFARNDRRHDMSVVGNYEISPKLVLSCAWIFNTGAPFTLKQHRGLLPNISVEDPTTRVSDYIPNEAPMVSFSGHGLDEGNAVAYERYNFRFEPYHRLDINLQVRKRVGKKKKVLRIWQYGAYNAYNRNNPFFYDVDRGDPTAHPRTRKTNKWRIYHQSLFPIVPFITLRYEF